MKNALINFGLAELSRRVFGTKTMTVQQRLLVSVFVSRRAVLH